MGYWGDGLGRKWGQYWGRGWDVSDLGSVFEGLKWKFGSLGNWRRRADDSKRLSLRSSCPCDETA